MTIKVLVVFRALLRDFREGEFVNAVAISRLERRESNVTQTDVPILTPCINELIDSGDKTSNDQNKRNQSEKDGDFGTLFYYTHLQDEQEAKEVAQRCVLLRGIYRVFGHGLDFRQMTENCTYNYEHHPEYYQPLTDTLEEQDTSFKVYVKAIGKKTTQPEQLVKMEQCSILESLPGPVRLNNPAFKIFLFEENFSPAHQRHFPDDQPQQVFLCREIAEGTAIHRVSKYELKERAYIGTTSQDAELAFIMCNYALVRRGSIVYDPFAGTGSNLISATADGAFVLGSDIDSQVLRGAYGWNTPEGMHKMNQKKQQKRQAFLDRKNQVRKSRNLNESQQTLDLLTDGTKQLGLQDEQQQPLREQKTKMGWQDWQAQARSNIFSNFYQYHLPLPLGIINSDIVHSPWRHQPRGWLDAIITDVPYGIREGLRTTDTAKTKTGAVVSNHIDTTSRIRALDCVSVLVQMAADHLVVRGRLVYWLPCTPDFRPDELPQHPALEILSYSPQVLSARLHRRLVVMEKVRESNLDQSVTLVDPASTNLSYANLAATVLRQPHRTEELVKPVLRSKPDTG